MITRADPGYPALLGELPDPPPALFMKGELTGADDPAVAIVGSRRASPYGLAVARTLGRTDGLVKVIAEKRSGLVLGVGIVGPMASELIAEGTLAIEMGATLEDIMVTIHPHPTLSEALLEAAEVAAGEAVHVNPPRKVR